MGENEAKKETGLKPLKLDYPQTIKVGFAFAIIMVFWSAYDYVVPLLLENTFGLSNSMRGLIMGLDNLLSLFLLPLFGKLSDKADNKFSRKYGRRTPFIVIGTLAAVILMVFVPVSALGQTKKADKLINDYTEKAYDLNDTFLAERLEYFYSQAEEGNGVYCDLAYLESNKVSKEEYLAIRYDDNLKSKKAVLNFIGAETYTYDGVEVTLDTEVETPIGRKTVQEIKDGNAMYKKYVTTGMNEWLSREVNKQVTSTKDGVTTLAVYMVILLLVLIAMATFRSPAVALMPDVTPKPLRSQGNAIINLAGGIGSAFAFLIYTVAFFFETVYTYTIIFAAVGIVMLLLLVGFILLVKERKFVEKCEKICKDYGIDDEEESAIEEDAPALTAETPTEAETAAFDAAPISQPAEEAEKPAKKKFVFKNPFKAFKEKPKEEQRKFISFILILSSVFMWFMGNNAVSSNMSIYITKGLNLSSGVGGLISGISMGVSAIAFIPVGFMAAKLGRKKTIMIGLSMAIVSYLLLALPIVVTGAMSSDVALAALFALFYLIAGFGLIIINVNTFPMVVELSDAGNVGKFTGFYYTATMSAQAITPFIAGLIMDEFGRRSLFWYAFACVILSLVLMLFVKHGDSKQITGRKMTKEEKKQLMLDSMGDAD